MSNKIADVAQDFYHRHVFATSKRARILPLTSEEFYTLKREIFEQSPAAFIFTDVSLEQPEFMGMRIELCQDAADKRRAILAT